MQRRRFMAHERQISSRSKPPAARIANTLSPKSLQSFASFSLIIWSKLEKTQDSPYVPENL